MTQLLLFVFIIVNVWARAGVTCSLDADQDLGQSLKLATFSGKLPELIEKHDLTGACYEVGLMMGRVQAVKDALFPACRDAAKLKISTELKKCQPALQSLQDVCKQDRLKQLSSSDQLKNIKDLYGNGLNCLDLAAGNLVGPNGHGPSQTAPTAPAAR